MRRQRPANQLIPNHALAMRTGNSSTSNTSRKSRYLAIKRHPRALKVRLRQLRLHQQIAHPHINLRVVGLALRVVALASLQRSPRLHAKLRHRTRRNPQRRPHAGSNPSHPDNKTHSSAARPSCSRNPAPSTASPPAPAPACAPYEPSPACASTPASRRSPHTPADESSHACRLRHAQR